MPSSPASGSDHAADPTSPASPSSPPVSSSQEAQNPPSPPPAAAVAVNATEQEAARVAAFIDSALRAFGVPPPPPVSGIRVFFASTAATNDDNSSRISGDAGNVTTAAGGGGNYGAPTTTSTTSRVTSAVTVGPDAASVALVESTPAAVQSSAEGPLATFFGLVTAAARDAGILDVPETDSAAVALPPRQPRGSRKLLLSGQVGSTGAGSGWWGGKRGTRKLRLSEEPADQQQDAGAGEEGAAAASSSSSALRLPPSAQITAVIDATGAAPGVHRLALWARNYDDGGTAVYAYVNVTVLVAEGNESSTTASGGDIGDPMVTASVRHPPAHAAE